MVAPLTRPRSRRGALAALVCLVVAAVVVATVVGIKLKKKKARGPIQVPEPQVLASPPPPVSEAEREALFAPGRGSALRTWSLLGGVSLYQRNGFVEHYATDFRERRSRPIRIDRVVLPVTGDRGWLRWWPDRTPNLANAELLEAAFAGDAPATGSITIGLLLASGDCYLFQHTFGDVTPPAAPKQPPFFPNDFLADLARAPAASGLARQGNRLRAALPSPLQERLTRDGDRAVRCWFVRLAGLAGTEVGLDHLSLLQPGGARAPGQTVTLAGSIRPWPMRDQEGAGSSPPVVSALLESGQALRGTVQEDGTFSLAGVPADMPIRVAIESRKQDYFATLGRWFIPGGDRADLVIDLSTVYQNADGHEPDPALRSREMDAASGVTDLYKVHSRQVWNGYEGHPQEYEGRSFSNNIGDLDRDRFFDNPDRCYRIVHLGSSHAVGCQVRPGDKYNLLMEAELGVRLGRPVEVISAGRNNGDLAANFARARDLARKFEPDVVLLEHGSFLMMQTHPELVRRMHGLDPSRSHLDNFYYDACGELTFRRASSDWPLHVQKADISELVAGVPFYDTLRVPPEQMHPAGRDAFRYLGDIMRYYHKELPGRKVLLHTGLDQAQAYGKYNRTAKLADGTVIPVGVEVFLEHMAAFSAREGIVCLQPDLPQGYNDKPETYLTFVNDGHFSPRGHQWLARELSVKLIKALGLIDVTDNR